LERKPDDIKAIIQFAEAYMVVFKQAKSSNRSRPSESPVREEAGEEALTVGEGKEGMEPHGDNLLLH